MPKWYHFSCVNDKIVVCSLLAGVKMGYYLRGLDDQIKDKIATIGKAKFGTSTISKTVITILNEYFNEEENLAILNKENLDNDKSILSDERVKVSATIFKTTHNKLLKLCEERKITPSYFLKSCILKALGRSYILDGNDLEILRKSNYQLTKIGVNINQIAKRINTMNAYDVNDISELKTLSDSLEQHTNEVKLLLERTQDKW